ncbi:MAG: HAMP domain-containing protein [Actinomycetota bacterium]
MFESLLAVPLHFTVEFLGFLVASGAAILAVSRPGLVPGPASNRVSVALGFAALALAHVIHGAAFDPDATDGSQIVVAAKTLGFALILIGVVGALRPTGTSAMAAFIVEPLVLAPAGAALLVGFASLSASKRDEGASYRRLALAMFLFAVAEVLTASAPEAVFGAGDVHRSALVAHLLRSLASVAVASWFWSEIVSSIRVRFVASFAALLVAVVLALSTTLTGVISSNVRDEEFERVRSQASNATRSLEEGIGGDLSRSVRSIAGFEDVQDALATDANPQSLAQALADRNLFDVDFIVVDTPRSLPGFVGNGPSRGTTGREFTEPSLSKSQKVGIIGSDVYTVVSSRRTNISVNATRVLDGTRQFVAVIAATNVFKGPDMVGTIALGEWVDDLYMSGIENQLSAQASLIAGSRVVASTLPRRQARSLAVPEDIETELQLTNTAASQLDLGPRSYFSGFSLIESAGKQIGVFVVSAEARVVVSARSAINRLLFLAAMLVGAIALIAAWYSGRRITRPIQELTETAASVREGDLTAQAPVRSNDEVGQLGETFNEMTASLIKMTSDLRQAAREEHALRSRIETIIQSMADGLVAVDAGRRILAFNREAEHLTGVSAEEAIGRPVSDVLSVTDPQGEAIALPIDSLSEGSLGGVMLRRSDDDPVPVAITTAVLRGEDGEIAGGVTVMRDMSREREIERMKTEFL